MLTTTAILGHNDVALIKMSARTARKDAPNQTTTTMLAAYITDPLHNSCSSLHPGPRFQRSGRRSDIEGQTTWRAQLIDFPGVRVDPVLQKAACQTAKQFARGGCITICLKGLGGCTRKNHPDVSMEPFGLGCKKSRSSGEGSAMQ
jgi:hypothetical protein